MILLDASFRIAIVAALVSLVLVALRVRSASVRHATWTLVLATMLLMPVLTSIVPAIGISNPGRVANVFPASSARSGVPADATTSAIVRTADGDALPPRDLAVGVSDGRIRVTPAQPRVPIWLFATAAYALVAIGLLVRLLAGWRAVARLARTSTSVPAGCAAPVLESSLVATPVTAGVFASMIILPREWRAWPPEKLRACLAHEMAHIRRRDTLVAFLAKINRCIFWFHPLAWWLERTLAAWAEEAADEAAVREIGSRRRYAEVLLDIADAVRLRGARVAWQAVGAGGTGLLGRRVDRVLRGDGHETSRARTAIVFVTCTAAILFVVACRQRPAPPPLKADPEVAQRIEKQTADRAAYERAKNMTAAEVDALEASLKQTPGDLEALRTLRSFYQASGQKVFGWDAMLARRRPHVLWLIENRPEDDLAIWQVSAQADPVTYAEAKKRWLAHTARPDASETILTNAAHFFAQSEPQIAEGFLIRAKASSRLGHLYAEVIKGPTNPRNGSPLTPLDSDPYARDVRRRVVESTDPLVLKAAGQRLAMTYRDEGRRLIGQQLLQRALELDPQQHDVRAALIGLNHDIRRQGLNEKTWSRAASITGGDIAAKVAAQQSLTREEQRRVRDAEPQAIAELTEAERFTILPERADREYMLAESYGWNNEPAAADRAFARSKRYAQDALALAPSFRDDPDYGKAIYHATVALAAHALREGDRSAAVRYMREAVKAPPSRGLETRTFGLDSRLVNYLLKEGERESVAEFLERSADLRPADRERLLKDAAAIRAGQMPMGYQGMMSR